MKIIVNISMILIFVLSTSLFAAKQPKQKKYASEPEKAVSQPNIPIAEPNLVIDVHQAGATAVTVNGTVITEGQIEAILNPRMQQMADRIPPNMTAQYRQQMRKRVIEQLVIEELLAQKEKQMGIDVNEAELVAQINKQVSQQNLTIDEFKALLKAYGTSFSDYEQNTRKRLLFEKLMETQFTNKLQKPTDEQAKAFYNENIQQFSEPERIHTKHILIKTDDSNIADPNLANTQAKAKAREILEKIKAGESFEELAKQYSACPSAKNGGDLGLQPKGTFVPEFEKAAFALKPGQVSDVVQTSFGYHIIKLIEHIDANTVSFDQAKEQILQVLSDKQKEQIVMDYIRQIKAQADIKFSNESDKLETEINGIKPSRKAAENPDGNSQPSKAEKKD